MEKQQKVLKNIHKTVAATTLGTKNNDECYTSMQDILNELVYWANLNKFVGKNIICPCDWDITDDQNIYSIEIKYKDTDVEVLGNNVYKAVESVIVDLWAEDNEITRINLKEDEIEDFLRDKLTCNFVRTLTQNARAWGIKSITASGFNPATNRGVKFQDVDYSKYDICITNPPFSLFPAFMKCMINKIDFIILAPFMNRNNPSVGLPLMLKQAYLGYNCSIHIDFNNPTINNKFKTKRVLCDWLVSYNDAQIERNHHFNTSGIKYQIYKDEYVRMDKMIMKDGGIPIRVPGCQIPDDYNGWMFSDISVISRLSHDEYEWYGTHFIGYYNKVNPAANPFLNKASDTCLIDANNKSWFGGVVFKRKSKV